MKDKTILTNEDRNNLWTFTINDGNGGRSIDWEVFCEQIEQLLIKRVEERDNKVYNDLLLCLKENIAVIDTATLNNENCDLLFRNYKNEKRS